MYKAIISLFNSVQFSRSVVSYSLWPHELQHARPHWPTPTPITQIHIYWVSDAIQPSLQPVLCCPLLLLPPILPSLRVFSNESTLRIRWPMCWSFSFNVSPSKEYLELISFRMDWFDLHAVEGTLKSLLQHHSSKALILWCSAFFIVHLSHPYFTHNL